ncbi:MAG TPA: methylated-DNA--[protein]-cysteine S-methyltransferase [Gammaproteobacteria bacterium]|nr:methylated-DNA--[protein]-cysteine S-methyltransferase [Gammaproteobacteria bacterium]
MYDYDRIARIINFLDEHHTRRPDLTELAELSGLSPYHFHRLFTRWAGITPHQFLNCLSHSHARQLLRKGESVLDAALESGLSGPGRLHDLCVKLEAASPGEIKSGGNSWVIRSGFANSHFGTCLVGENPRGICHLSFAGSKDQPTAENLIHENWPDAEITWDNTVAKKIVNQIFSPGRANKHPPLRAVVNGTRFQVRVWQALLKVPSGSLVSYGQLARAIGQPDAARAVGSAVASNPVAYLIPCHRVIRETGVIGNYRWGQTRKKALLAWETAPQTTQRAEMDII